MAEQATAPARRTWLESLVGKTKIAGSVLVIVALCLGGLAIWIGLTYGKPQWPLWVYTALIAVACLAGGMWLAFDSTHERQDALDRIRLFVLALGGTVGLLTVFLGCVLGYMWWDNILALTQAGGPDAKITGSERTLAIYQAVLPLPILILGMGITFLCLLLARTDERSSPSLRRLLYGYNAVVQGMLAVLIVIVANVFVAMKFNKPIDFTSATFYTLSPMSETILHSLDQPVKVVVLLDPGVRDHGFLLSLIKPMMANCQAVTDKLDVEYLASDPTKDALRVDELRKKYPDVGAGLLVIYGAGGDSKGSYKLIKPSELIGEDPMRGQAAFDFRGENALMTEIDFLANGQKKIIVYVAQGNGELDLKDSQLDDPSSRDRGQRRPNLRGCGMLKERLEKRNMDVRPLEFSITKPEVPGDAEVVAILGPKKTLPQTVIKALDDYVGRKGKLLVLLGPEPGTGGSAQRTGLEELLARYGVDLPSEAVYSAKSPSGDPRLIVGEPNQKFEGNPLVSRFLNAKPIVMMGARPVRPLPRQPGMSPFAADPVLVADREYFPWVEGDVTLEHLDRAWRELARNPQVQERKLGPGQQNPIPLGLAVTESAAPANPHMMMAPPPSGDQTPRMVVVGSSTMASNFIISGQFVDSSNADYIAGCVDWLRGKTNTIGISPKKSSVYSLPPTLRQSANYWAFVLLPALIICLGVAGAGTGVWLVRRR